MLFIFIKINSNNIMSKFKKYLDISEYEFKEFEGNIVIDTHKHVFLNITRELPKGVIFSIL